MNKITQNRKDTYKVSVGMPVYNSEHWISQSIESILSQSFENFELIISDNNSSDNTSEICKDYASKDNRVFFHKNEDNIGAANNFNKVFELSNGKYFKWASSNDLCGIQFLELCVQILDTYEDVVVASPRTQLIDKNNNVIQKLEEDLHLMQENSFDRFDTFLNKVTLNNVEQGLIRSSALNKTMLQAVYPNSDTILMSELAARGKFYQIQEYLLSRRITETSTTNLMSESQIAEFYSPDKSKISLQTIRVFLANLSIAFRIKTSFNQRLKFIRYAFRYLKWERKDLYQELAYFFKQAFKFNRKSNS